METVIYIDVLVFLNIIITFILLLSASRLMKLSPSPGRFLLGSLLGGATSLIIFAPDMGFFLSVITKLLLSVIIVITVYKPKSVKALLRETGYFFTVSFIFAGMMLFVSSLPGIDIVSYNNGAVYVNFSFFSLIAASVICYLVTLVLGKITKHKVCDTLCRVDIELGGVAISGQAIIDTGNSLCDPFSGESIMIADKFFLKEIIPPHITQYIDGNTNDCVGIKLIPCSTVSSDSLLPVFRVDRMKISGSECSCELEKVQIAVSKRKMTSAIIPAELTANGERRKKNAESAK